MGANLVWVAYCLTCGKELDRCANGSWAEAVAKQHTVDTLAMRERLLRGEAVNAGERGHEVMVGYTV
jgi:hypothetical protein